MASLACLAGCHGFLFSPDFWLAVSILAEVGNDDIDGQQRSGRVKGDHAFIGWVYKQYSTDANEMKTLAFSSSPFSSSATFRSFGRSCASVRNHIGNDR